MLCPLSGSRPRYSCDRDGRDPDIRRIAGELRQTTQSRHSAVRIVRLHFTLARRKLATRQHPADIPVGLPQLLGCTKTGDLEALVYPQLEEAGREQDQNSMMS
jgi:hypothetical protein